jgi:DNA repair exonuclease SbcCD nuclease subunit
MKIIHTADWHFREKDHDEIYKCVRYIADRAAIEQPDLIIISGDITDSRHLDLDSRSARSILEIISFMLDVAPVAIVIGTPSHDGKASLALRSCRGKHPILVSDRPEQFGYFNKEKRFYNIKRVDFEIDELDFVITQIPQPTKQYFVNDMSIEDTDKAISNAMDAIFASFGGAAEKFENIPHIVNGHGQIGGAFISETQQLIGRDIEISKSQLSILNADLICYGHLHLRQDMGDYILYAGSPTRMNHGETEDKGFWIHKLLDSGQLSVAEFIKTPARYLHDAKFDLTNKKDDIDIMPTIESMCEGIAEDYSDWGCKITITVWQDEAKTVSRSAIEDLLCEYNAQTMIVNIVRKPRETVRAEKVLEAENLPDKIKAMAELRGEKIDDSILNKAALLESGEKEPWKCESYSINNVDVFINGKKVVPCSEDVISISQD